MRKFLLSLTLLPIIVTNSASVSTKVENVVSGGETRTEITNIVNGKEVHVESSEPGEIRVEVKNGEVKIETSASASIDELEIMEKEESLKNRIYSFFNKLFLRLSRFFRFRP